MQDYEFQEEEDRRALGVEMQAERMKEEIALGMRDAYGKKIKEE